jgi:hypothetical protein
VNHTKISLAIIATLGLALGIGIFASAYNNKGAQTISLDDVQTKGTNCLECATPGSRAALIKKSIANFEEEKPSKE